MKKFLFLLTMVSIINACDKTEDVLESVGLSDSEIVAGLKEALKVGTDTAVSRLNAVDGYYKDVDVKLFLPSEADVIVDNISRLGPAGDALVEEAILKINRAAEDAASEATPIFVDAIVGITIADSKAILEGPDDAATQYLKAETYDDLQVTFQPKIENSLSKKIVGNVSAESAYASLITTYNTGSLNGILYPEIETNSLSEYTTTKALDGLFFKVAEEEGKIRNDVNHRVNDILEKVFGE